ncbi:hypothetical protein ABPG75_006164 [Micractinium tetrahymenae]
MALSDLDSLICEGNDFTVLAGHLIATIYAWVPTSAGIVVLLFGLLQRLLLRTRSRTYGGSSLEQQLVTPTHALFTAHYAIQIVPYTILVCRILFADDFLQSFVRWNQGAFAILDSHLVLYSFEGALRALFLIFDCMATYEVLLFATLAARRLGASHAVVRILLFAGMTLYAATRVLQLAVLVPFFTGAYSQLAGCAGLALWWAMLVLTAALLLIQVWTFRIYAGVWRRHRPGLPASGSSAAGLGHTTEGSSISISMSESSAPGTGSADKQPAGSV